MHSGLIKFFNSKKVIIAVPILFLIFEAVSEFFYYLTGWVNIMYSVERAILAALLIVLAVSYCRHDKNVMKGMMGAVLMGIIFSELPFAKDMFTSHDYYMDVIGPVWNVYEILVIATLVGYGEVFVTHFVINSDHKSNPAKIKINQIVVILVLLIYLAEMVISIVIRRSPYFMVAKIASFLANVSLLTMVVCIESKLDAYRIEREANGWTEE